MRITNMKYLISGSSNLTLNKSVQVINVVVILYYAWLCWEHSFLVSVNIAHIKSHISASGNNVSAEVVAREHIGK